MSQWVEVLIAVVSLYLVLGSFVSFLFNTIEKGKYYFSIKNAIFWPGYMGKHLKFLMDHPPVDMKHLNESEDEVKDLV